MHSLFPLFFASFWILIFGLVEILLLRLLNKVWWRNGWVRRPAIALPILGVIAVLVWGTGEYLVIPAASIIGGIGVALTFILEICLMISLPFSGVIHSIDHLIHRHQQKQTEPADVPVSSGRRLFLKGAAAALPLISVSMGAAGVGRSLGKINLPFRRISVAGLPLELDGLRILQISDSHLWHYTTLEDLSALCEIAAPQAPDLVLVTGDVADDISQLPSALDLIAQLRPPLGVYAIPGNHEYFRGIETVRRIYDKSPIPLFVNRGIRITSSGRTFYLAGIDDPRHLHDVSATFFQQTVDLAMQDHAAGEFTVLMSHRPDAFDYAASRAIPFMLSGHTHGGQIGFLGRSVFEPMFPRRYLWGTYRQGSSVLYTTAGAGHWLPFRLGCPPEAPMIELRRA
jgi:predicted MPP superfamily phosphohydrolase